LGFYAITWGGKFKCESVPLINLQLFLLADVAMAKEQWNGRTGRTLSALGFGARTILAGYPVRFDIAWPVTTGGTPVWYLSLNGK